MNDMSKYDVIVIGGGAGGLTVAAGSASMGAKVALIEKEKQLGGDCLHYGCVPSKALIQSAKMVKEARQAALEFGLELKGVADLSVAKERVRKAIATIQEHDDPERFRKLGVDVYHSYGRFKDNKHVELDTGEVLEGKRIIIATGSRPMIPQIEGVDEVNYLTNETIFDLDKAPKRLGVIGAGPIGLELAQAMARFGSKVTVIESSSTIFNQEDEDVIPPIQEVLEKELTLILNSKVEKVQTTETGIILTIASDDQKQQIEVDELLIAAGRKPNIEGLGLEHAGVKIERGHIVVKDTLQTAAPNIYAIGDVNGKFPFTHGAGAEGKTVIANAVFGLKKKMNYDHMPWVTYTDPEVYHLGLTEEQARKKFGENISVYRVSTGEVDRFVADRDLNGLVKVITNKSGIIVGAHAVGKSASDWMQEIVFAKQHGHKIGDLSSVIHPYPTHGAILQQTADQYWRKKLFGGWIPKLTKKYIQWFR
jgi:pyruvate/2-oxoglutarate dehydrogenase complex dihydrolipoamide dehydrogenase (E3) component